ncbi:NHL repeat-containing protein [Herbiconiux ginsengi]|nr:hypothetical protein [Herbiconiux ginsengi]
MSGDSGVWVANAALDRVGRFDVGISELNTVTLEPVTDPVVAQSGAVVLALDASSNSLEQIDPATARIVRSTTVPLGARAVVALAETVISAPNGDLWVVPSDDVDALDAATAPDLRLGGGGVVSTTPDGGVLAVSTADDAVFRSEPGVPLTSAPRTPVDLSGGSIQAVGTSHGWIVHEADSATLLTSTGPIDLSGVLSRTNSVVALQQSADTPRRPAASSQPERAYLATSTTLVEADLATHEVRRVSTGHSGHPARPVVVGGCTYAAWSDGSTWRSCRPDGGGEPVVTTGVLPDMRADAQLVFQTNGDGVLLNDPDTGSVWAVQADNQVVGNWGEIILAEGGSLPVTAVGEEGAKPSAEPSDVFVPLPTAETPSPKETPRIDESPLTAEPPPSPADPPAADPPAAPEGPTPLLIQPTPVTAVLDESTGTVTLAWAPFGGVVASSGGYFAQNLGLDGSQTSAPCTGQSKPPSGGEVVATGDSTTITFSGVDRPGATYGFLVWGYNDHGCAASALVTVSPHPSPSQITALTGGMIESGTAWEYRIDEIGPTADHYEVQRMDREEGVGGIARFFGTGVIPRTLTEGPFGTPYAFRIRGCNAESDGGACGPWLESSAPDASLTLEPTDLLYDESAAVWTWAAAPDNAGLEAVILCGSFSGAGGKFTADSTHCGMDSVVASGDAWLKVVVSGHSYRFRP